MAQLPGRVDTLPTPELLELVSADVYGVYRPGIQNVHQRVFSEHDKVAPLAALDCAQVIGAQPLRVVLCARLDSLHGCEARLDHKLHLPMEKVAGKTARGAAVSAAAVGDSSIGELLEVRLRLSKKLLIVGKMRIATYCLPVLWACESLHCRR